MSDQVWISRAFVRSAPLQMVKADIYLNDPKRAVEVGQSHQNGRGVPLEDLPNAFYGDYTKKKLAPPPDVFLGNGYLCMSAKAADVLERFDLGPGGLKPIGIFQIDQVTPVKGSYYLLNFGAYKDCFVPEESASVRKLTTWDPPAWLLQSEVGDGNIAVSHAALGGADLWTDPRLLLGFFVSDPLAAALQEEGVADGFDFEACRIV